MNVVLITGATGFVGERIAMRFLQNGSEVRVLTRRGRLPDSLSHASCLRADLTSLTRSDALNMIKDVDVVIHCAGEISQPERMRALHVNGTRVLADAAAGRVKTWVQVSSAGALGPHAVGVVDESCRRLPVGEYETTKAEADDIVLRLFDETSTRCVILLPTIVFGKEMPNPSLRRMIGALLNARIRVLPDKHAYANYVHVEDVAVAVERAVRSDAVGRYIISDSVLLTRFVEAALAGAEPEGRIHALPGFLGKGMHSLARWTVLGRRRRPLAALTNRAVYTSDRARRELGWSPEVGWETGINEAAAAWTQAGEAK